MRNSIPILLITTLCACGGNSESEDQENKVDRFEKEKITFLNRPIIKNNRIQDSLFDVLSGMWEFVLWENHENHKEWNQKYHDVLFRQGLVWPLDYPCSWEYKVNSEKVYMTSDSIFFTQDQFNYLDEASYEIRNDTLIITRSEYIEYYIRKEYDLEILDKLEKFEFNEDCIYGRWKLTQISDSILNTFVIQDSTFMNAPRVIDLSKYKFEGDLLVNIEDTSQFFQMEQFIRLFDYGGDRKHFLLKDIQKLNGSYNYLYEPE